MRMGGGELKGCENRPTKKEYHPSPIKKDTTDHLSDPSLTPYHILSGTDTSKYSC